MIGELRNLNDERVEDDRQSGLLQEGHIWR
jgi:hypothetical protein